MKTPAILSRLQRGVRRALAPNLIGERDTFVHLVEVRALRAVFHCSSRSPAKRLDTKSFRRHVMKQVAPFIRAIWPGVETGRAWTNSSYCPPTAMGDYYWVFQVEMVQELIWLRPEFVAGFRYAAGPKEAGRDGNPYPWGDHRSDSWDAGYILSLANLRGSKERPRMKKWLQWLESDDCLPKAA